MKRSDKIILIDNNQIILSSIFTAAKTAQSEDDYGPIRPVLNTYRKYFQSFSDYGELIICNDSKMFGEKIFSKPRRTEANDRKNQNLIGVKS